MIVNFFQNSKLQKGINLAVVLPVHKSDNSFGDLFYQLGSTLQRDQIKSINHNSSHREGVSVAVNHHHRVEFN